MSGVDLTGSVHVAFNTQLDNGLDLSTWELPGHKWWLKPQTWLRAEGLLG